MKKAGQHSKQKGLIETLFSINSMKINHIALAHYSKHIFAPLATCTIRPSVLLLSKFGSERGPVCVNHASLITVALFSHYSYRQSFGESQGDHFTGVEFFRNNADAHSIFGNAYLSNLERSLVHLWGPILPPIVVVVFEQLY